MVDEIVKKASPYLNKNEYAVKNPEQEILEIMSCALIGQYFKGTGLHVNVSQTID
jgi:hypothetical protein